MLGYIDLSMNILLARNTGDIVSNEFTGQFGFNVQLVLVVGLALSTEMNCRWNMGKEFKRQNTCTGECTMKTFKVWHSCYHYTVGDIFLGDRTLQRLSSTTWHEKVSHLGSL